MAVKTRPMTLTEKILLQHAIGRSEAGLAPGDIVRIRVDWTLASEIAWSGMNKSYEELGRPPLFEPERFYLALDHTVDRGTLAHDPRTQHLVQLSRSFAREAGIRHFHDANTTIMHTEFYRQLVRPGEVVLGADSHTSSHGGMAAFAIGLGGADIVAAMIQGFSWIQVPESIRVHFAGQLPFGLTGKDVILRTLGQLGRNTAALERTVEYTGDCLEEFSTDFRFTVANMTAELGGLNGIFPADSRVLETMSARRDPAFREGGWWFKADPDAEYVNRFEIDLGALTPQIARPFSPDNTCGVDEAVGQPLDGCFIGACTTTEEELVLAALVLQQALAAGERPVAGSNRLMVPGSLEIAGHLEEAGLLEVYRQAGFRIGEPACSMCIGIGSDRAQPGEVWLSSQNRNFPNRMGKGSIAWLASAPTVAVSSLGLSIRDPRPFIATVDRDRMTCIASARRALPPVVYSEPELAAEQPPTLSPAAAEEGAGLVIHGLAQLFGDHVDTDAMIAGEFCHLSDPAVLGPKAFLHFRRDFGERIARGEDILVAGEAWGTGSSREQAIWALKGAGVRAVIAKSFAYIHKRNLVNEALPFLVVEDPEFYRAVQDGDGLEVDTGSGEVKLGGKVFRGVAPAAAMREIIVSGGLVPHMRKTVAAVCT